MTELLTVGDVAAAAKLSRSAVYRAIDAGELDATKLRGRLRITAAAYEAWLERHTVRREPMSFERSVPSRPAARSGTFADKLAERRGRAA